MPIKGQFTAEVALRAGLEVVKETPASEAWQFGGSMLRGEPGLTAVSCDDTDMAIDRR